MRRIFPDYAYGAGPRAGCWWDETVALPRFEPLRGDVRCDVAIVGGGFTGLSAALHLARAGASVAVLEAQRIGWGASGRNGGFCCLGGSKASDRALDRRFGRAARLEYRASERAAVELVGTLIRELGLDVDRHSEGETLLAHRARDAAGFEAEARAIEENYGVVPEVAAPEAKGMGGRFFGAMTTPIGFGLNPRKYLSGLLDAALAAGVQVFEQSPVMQLDTGTVATRQGRVVAGRVILATNGYSSEDVPHWMQARYMPAQSTVLVTRPLTQVELETQGWTSRQMAYDSRHLLHYFRLMPDNRFLFGMRGGLRSGPRAEARARAAVMRDFCKMFPGWRNVEVAHSWSGLVCLTHPLVPFVGPVPDTPGVLAGFAYHGNGVAMGSFAGACLAELAQGKTPSLWPDIVRHPPRRFPLGRLRRALMPPVYAAYGISDRL